MAQGHPSFDRQTSDGLLSAQFLAKMEPDVIMSASATVLRHCGWVHPSVKTQHIHLSGFSASLRLAGYRVGSTIERMHIGLCRRSTLNHFRDISSLAKGGNGPQRIIPKRSWTHSSWLGRFWCLRRASLSHGDIVSYNMIYGLDYFGYNH